jgi:hypothetical protein
MQVLVLFGFANDWIPLFSLYIETRKMFLYFLNIGQARDPILKRLVIGQLHVRVYQRTESKYQDLNIKKLIVEMTKDRKG